MAIQIQLRRDTAANWTSSNPVLAQGEIGVETNTGKIKVGNGSTAWNSLSYYNADLTATSPLSYSNGTLSLNQGSISIAQSQVTNLVTDLAAKASLSGATFTGAVSGTDLTLSGDLTVNGTTTNINTQNLVVEDKNIVIGDVATPTNTTADGGGITLKGATDKTLNWVNATSAWTSSEDFNLASGKVYEINGTTVLSSSQVLGKSVPSGTIVGTSDTQTLTNKTLTAPKITSASHIADVNGNELIIFPTAVASAVNEVTVSNAATGGTPSITASGGDTNVSLNLVAKGSGTVQAGGVPIVTTTGTQTLTNKTLTAPVISTISNTGTVTFPTATTTLVGRDTTDTLTNKSIALGSNTLTGTLSQFNTAVTDADLAPTASPTFSGTVTLPSTTSIGTVTSTEIGHLSGVTSAIQTQLNGKLGTSATAASSTNIAGGSAGQIPYQSGAGTTLFTSTGTAGQVLTSNGTSAPTWSAPAETGFNAFFLSGM